MLELALIFVILVVFLLRPFWQEYKEDRMAEQLKNTHSAAEAMAMLDGAMQHKKQEIGFWAKLRESYFFWL